MKKTLVILMGLSLALLIGCEDKGVTQQWLSGEESNLPKELKGLKVYRVSCGEGDYVKVGVLNNDVVSTTYQDGKAQKSIIMVNNGTQRTINIESIISENDSIMVIKKSTK